MIKKILNLFNKIPNDKLQHFFASYLLLIILSFFLPLFYAYTFLVLIALSKEEIYDGYLKKGNKDYVDLLYGCLPIIFNILINL